MSDKVLKIFGILGILWSALAFVAVVAFFTGEHWALWKKIYASNEEGGLALIEDDSSWVKRGGFGVLADGACPAGFSTSEARTINLSGIRLLSADTEYYKDEDFADSDLEVRNTDNGPLASLTLKACFKRLED